MRGGGRRRRSIRNADGSIRGGLLQQGHFGIGGGTCVHCRIRQCGCSDPRRWSDDLGTLMCPGERRGGIRRHTRQLLLRSSGA